LQTIPIAHVLYGMQTNQSAMNPYLLRAAGALTRVK
jgi:hypothetical protein